MNPDDAEFERQAEALFGDFPEPPPASAEMRDQLRREALEAFDRAEQAPANAEGWRLIIHKGGRIMIHPAMRMVAAAAAVAIVALWIAGSRQTLAFADLLKPIVEAKTARFKVSVKNDLQPKPMEGVGYFLAPDSFRQEIGEAVQVTNFAAGRMLSLSPSQKQATVMNLKNFDEVKRKNSGAGSLFGNLQAVLADYQANKRGQVEELGEKEIDGRRVFGFRLAMPTMTQTIWGDLETGNVARIDATMPGPPKSEVTMSDFSFDLPLEPALFSVDPPEGYKVMTLEMDVSPATEQEFIDALAKLLSATDGELPRSLDAMGIAAGAAKLLKSQGVSKEPTQEQMSEMFKVGKGLNFALTLPAEADAHYAGAGVKQDGPRVAIFWYKPAGSEKYRVIYSDLTTGDVDVAPQSPGAVRVIEQLSKPIKE